MRPVSIETNATSAPTEHMSRVLLRIRWVVRALWALAPLAVGPIAAQGFADASDAVRPTAFVIAWCAWLVGIVALVWAREAGYTALRVFAPLLLVVAAVGLADSLRHGTPMTVGASIAAAVIAIIVGSPLALQAQLDAASYGSELRFSLKTPPVLYLGPLPIAWVCIVLGAWVGPLLLAADRVVAGAIVCLIGLPLAALAVRSVHALSARWLVLVPAGVVVRDPMVLTDPILIPRDHIVDVGRAPAVPPEGAIDLRLGAAARSIMVRCNEPTEGMRIRKGRRDTVPVDSDRFLVAPARLPAFLAEYHRRDR